MPFTVENANHNHPVAAAGSLPGHRKLEPLDYHRAVNMLQENHTPRQARDLLHAEKEQLGETCYVTTKDLSNMLDRAMQQYKSGKTSTGRS